MIGIGRFGASMGLAGATTLLAAVGSSALADSFYLETGEVIEGRVLDGTLNTLTLETGGGAQLTGLHLIERAVLTLADGRELSGRPLGWTDGVLEVRAAGEVVRIADGRIIGDGQGGGRADVSVARQAGEGQEPILAMQRLPSFTLASGEKLVGEIVDATVSVMTMRPARGEETPLSPAQVETISVTDGDGAILSGKLLGWSDGVYRIQLDDRELLASLGNGETGAGSPARRTALAALQAAAAAADKGPAPDAPADDDRHHIETLVEPVDEGDRSITFRFQLSQPAARPLVILYAATEASAKAGEDFEAKSGVITFATGSIRAEVAVPIIDDERGEDSERFNLFLSGDPKTIAFSERQIVATIKDDD